MTWQTRSVSALQVVLLSAQQALLSRLVLQGKADRDINMRFGRLAFGSRARKFSEREHKQAAEEMLTDSGLAELEERVLAFLYAHSGSLELLALLDDVVRMLSQVTLLSSHLTTCKFVVYICRSMTPAKYDCCDSRRMCSPQPAVHWLLIQFP